jgi:xanthine phosphoribosyltransferase
MPQEKLSQSKTIITWEEIEKYSKKLGAAIADKFPQRTQLVAVSRGGLVPTALIAYQLGIRYTDTICLETYEKSIKLGRSRMIKSTTYDPYEGKYTVVIDDIVDSGETLGTVRRCMPNAKFAALFSQLPNEPDLVIQRIAADRWLRFPYEVNEYEDR